MSDDKKFHSAITIKYSINVFGHLVPQVLAKFPGFTTPISLLVDSGAEISILNLALARAVGLKFDINNKIMGSGVGSSFMYTIAKPVEIDIAGHKLEVAFNVLLDDYYSMTGILGHMPLFEKSKIGFRTYKKEFDIIFRK